ncbi:MAG: energy transducer TonB [Endomicrobium sp.]|jgi:TonB family protein|nr:energy transducer TonB [Endomicrobium sp.]
MLKSNNFFICFLISILLHALFFFFIVYGTEKVIYLSVPIDVTFYSTSHKAQDVVSLPVVEENSAGNDNNTDKSVSEIKEDQIKEEIKEPTTKTKDDITVKKEKTQDKQVKAKGEKKNVSKVDSSVTKSTSEKKVEKLENNTPTAPVETVQRQTTQSLQGENGSLYASTFFDAKNFQYPYYANQIMRKVKRQWRWAESYSNLRVLVHFQINKDGSVYDVSVKESSGNGDYDRNAMDTIRRASPFLELPEGYEGDSLGVSFEFKC